MELQKENKLYGPGGQPVAKGQLYALLVDASGNPVLDGSGNQQVVAIQSTNGRMQVDASITGSLVNIKTAPLVGVKTVGTVAAELFAGASRLITRGYMEVYNAGTLPIYYGASGVTTATGFIIQPGDSKVFLFSVDTLIYFIASASNSVNVEER